MHVLSHGQRCRLKCRAGAQNWDGGCFEVVGAVDEMKNTISYDELLANAKTEGHLVQLYDADEELLTRNVTTYLSEGLKLGEGLLVVATSEHLEAIPRRLEELGADYERAVREGRLVFLDAQETL